MAAAAIGVITAAVVTGLDLSAVLEPVEVKAYDLLFNIKSRLKPAGPDSRIALIGIDDATFGQPTFRKPMMLWYHHFADLIDALADSGAGVVALDFLLPDVMFDDYIPGYSRRWLKTLMSARMKKVPVIIGYMDLGGKRIIPHRNYLQILPPGHLGSFNLTTDSDDFIRRQRLWFEDPAGGKQRSLTFAYAATLARVPALKTPTDRIFIDYAFPRPAFPEFSFADVVRRVDDGDRKWLRDQFADRIVFIGSTDTRNQDNHPTPLHYLITSGRKNIPGVEIHAHISNTLLNQRFYREMPPYPRAGLYLGLAILVSLSVMFAGQRLILAALPVFLIVVFAASTSAFLNYRIFPLVPMALLVVTAHVSAFLYRGHVVNWEKRRLRHLFQRYLPPTIVTQLLETNETDFFSGKNKRLCILFSDVRGFTSYSENRTPGEIVSRLNVYFDAMAAEVTANGGIVDKFIGDGLLAFFGAVGKQDNPSLAAVRTALGMQKRLDDLNRQWAAQGEAPFRIGIGLHTGEVMVGNIGSEHKTEFTVIGDAVNLASRLESKTKELNAPILISETVLGDIRDVAEVEAKGRVAIKGRSAENTYHLIRIRRSI